MIEREDVHLDDPKKQIVVIRLPTISLVWPISIGKVVVESIVEVEIGAISNFNRVGGEIFRWRFDVEEGVGQDTFFFHLRFLVADIIHEVLFRFFGI